MNAPQPYREDRPWGGFVRYTHGEPSTVKILTVAPNQSLSLQYHRGRDEFWRVISGSGFARIGAEHIPLVPGAEHFIPRTTEHRLEAGAEPVVVLEISFGEFDESDIVRLEDSYGRA